MIDLIQGFRVGSTDPIDKRLVINGADIELGADEEVMPEKYISVNTEDGIFYVYDRESNTFTKASDFVDKSDTQYYKREKDAETGLPVPFDLEIPAEKDGDPETNIQATSGGSYDNYKHVSIDANDIVRRSGLTLAFYNNPAEEYQLYGALLDANNEAIAISNKIDIPLENAIREIKLSEDKKKLIAIEISGQEHVIDFQEVYDAFHLVNQEDLANEKARAEAAELVLTNDLAAEVQRAKSVEGDLNNLTTSDKTNLVAAINSEEVRAKAAELKLTQDLAQEIQNRKDAIDKEIADRTKAVSDEETRAKAAELKLNQDLAQETTRATTAEAGLDGRLDVIEGPATVDGSIKKALSDAKVYTDAERDRAVNKEGLIDSAISAEVLYRTNADNTITANLNSEIDRAKAAESTLTTNLNNEVNRASGAESTLTTDLDNEIRNRKDAINDVKALVSAEETRAKGIESGLRTDLSAEITRAKAKEDEIEGKLNTEFSRATDAEGTLTKNLNTEIQNRIDAVNTEKTRALDAEKVNSDAIKSEKSSREAADSNLTTRIATEESNRANADTTLQTGIGNEVSRATNAEEALSTRIDIEKARINTFYESVQEGTSPTNKLTNEEFVADAISKAGATFRGTYNIVTDLELPIDATREQVIQKLGVKVTVKDENDYVFVAIPDSYEAGAVCKYDRYKYSNQAWAYEYTLNNTAFTQAQWDAINSGATAARFTTIETNILDEVTRAKGAESTLTASINKEIQDRKDAIASEKTRAEGAEGTLTTNLANEVTNRTTADSTLQNNINEEATLRAGADITLGNRATAIEDKIPYEATSTNKLADKAYVDSKIEEYGAEFRGTVDSLVALKSLPGNKNDYAYYKHVVDSNTVYDRYRWSNSITEETGNWAFEIRLSGTEFTQTQWDAINSGATSALITKISTNEGNISNLQTNKADLSVVTNHIDNKNNPHNVTKEQLNLGNVDNTSDANKPISGATQNALDLKANIVDVYTQLQVDEKLDNKQDAISDLGTIRSGAELGATAVQPAAINDMATQTWVNDQGFLKEHQPLDDKTIIKGTDNKYQTAIGGWKEVNESLTQLFIDTKGTGLPTYVDPTGTTMYEVGWDYNTTITSLVGSETEATIKTKFTVLGTTFEGNVTLYKQTTIPYIWQSNDLTIGGATYVIKVQDQYIGTNNGGLTLVANDTSADLSESVMNSLALSKGTVETYHPIDNKFLKLDANTMAVNSNGELTCLTNGSVTKIKINDEEKTPTAEGMVDLGAVVTEHQNIKTINNQSLIGSGNLPMTFVTYTETEPTQDNNEGMFTIVKLAAEPTVRYRGYMYIITSA